jgi:hypothetical protein
MPPHEVWPASAAPAADPPNPPGLDNTDNPNGPASLADPPSHARARINPEGQHGAGEGDGVGVGRLPAKSAEEGSASAVPDTAAAAAALPPQPSRGKRWVPAAKAGGKSESILPAPAPTNGGCPPPVFEHEAGPISVEAASPGPPSPEPSLTSSADAAAFAVSRPSFTPGPTSSAGGSEIPQCGRREPSLRAQLAGRSRQTLRARTSFSHQVYRFSETGNLQHCSFADDGYSLSFGT